MRRVLGFIALLTIAGATGNPSSRDSTHAACRFFTNCTLNHTAMAFTFHVKGSRVIVEYVDKILFKLCCSHDTGVLLSADDSELPVMSRNVTVETAVFKGCMVPHGTYSDALNALNVTVSKKLQLQIPAEPKLGPDQLRGLQINNLEITATEPKNPPRPSFDYLTSVPKLVTLNLTDVVPEPAALLHLPIELEALNFTHVRFHASERELRKGNMALPWLKRLRSLRDLYLLESSSTVAVYPGDMVTLPQLASLPNLTDVTLYHVPLNENMLSSCFKRSALKNLVLESCGLTELPESMFEDCNVMKINLSNNNITSLPNSVFSPLQRSLRELDLSNNSVDGNALKDSLEGLKQLETLKVNNNPLGSLCGGEGPLRSGITNSLLPDSLHRLELRSTKATIVCSDWIKNNALTYIDLSNNIIGELSYSDLEMVRKSDEAAKTPVWLNLNDNPLRYIKVSSNNIEQCLRDFSDNRFKRVRVNIKLTELACDCDAFGLYNALRKCSLVQLDGDVPCLSDSVNSTHATLLARSPEDFLCPYNGPCVPGTECSCFKRPYDNATVVRCAGVLPTKPQWPAESDWPLALQVASGTLAAVPRVKLVELRASNNNITTLTVNDVPSTLSVLDLRNNSIAHISLVVAQRLRDVLDKKTYHSVFLAGNLLSCDCADAPAFGILSQLVNDWNETQCHDLSLVLEKTKSILCANLLQPILFGVVVPLLILVVVVLILQLLWPNLKLFLFRHNLCLNWILSVNDNIDDPDKTHDVFLSYAFSDLERLNILRTGLEKLGYSTIEHCRDWQPGDAVMEQIVRSVLCARRTLLLVSDNYAKSKWALEEFNAAHAHAMESRTARVLIVRCGLQKPDILPSDLKLYLDNHTYLAWEDPLFWYKLCRNMPPLGQEHKYVLFAALDTKPPFSKQDVNKQLSLESPIAISQHSPTVPAVC